MLGGKISGANLDSTVSAVSGFIRGVGMRVVVHFCGIIFAAIAQSTLGLLDEGAFTTKAAFIFLSYVGFVCLFPRGMSKRSDWIIPSGAGVLLCLFWIIWGVPWQCVVFWGGAVTWSVRALARKGQMGWEWTALPWLLIGLYGFISELRPLLPGSVPYWSLPVFVLGGWGALLAYSRARADSIAISMLRDSVRQLEWLLQQDSLPQELAAQARHLSAQAQKLASLGSRFDKTGAVLVANIDKNTQQLLSLKARSPILRLTDGRKAFKGQDPQEAAALSLERLNASLAEYLTKFQPPSSNDALEKRIRQFRANAETLVRKAAGLPEALGVHVRAISQSTEKILICMRDDPADVVPGDKFLSRYLGAADRVVDEYARLFAQGASQEEISQILKRGEELLGKLSTAFEEEHAQLLKNDTMNFTAELNVLDKLLKMDGKEKSH
ncbi:5-bromo-4-chloroindolyl phosphate hydrolysis family protein [Desulfovibrio sp. OttesenSCG-928-A18]|nr:5-bromo-4-chloroindolyl phosphate hydrolysis family protein [Desulfovibrio sp. OttesenSCG-928-A18]